MAYSVDDLYRLGQLIVNKNQQGYFSPEEFNIAINQAQLSWENWLVGQFQQYQTGKPLSRVSFGENSTVRQALTPAIYNYTLNPNTITGIAPYPGDFQRYDALISIYNYQKVRFFPQDSLTAYLDSAIDPIADNPGFELYDTGFKFWPSNIGAVRLSYVRKAPEIVWGYTIDSNDLPVYDPAQSADPIWYEIDCLEILARALRIIGVNLQAQDVSQYALEIKNAGQ